MNKQALIVAGLGSALISAFGGVKMSQAAPPIVMGYLPSYRETPNAAEIRFDRFTHIIQSFVTVDKDGEIIVPPQISAPDLVARAHVAGAKIILALSGGSNGVNFGKMVRDPQKSTRFVEQVVQLMLDSKADGLALDWEQPEAGDRDLTVQFVSALRAAMKAKKPESLLILVVNSLPGNSTGYDGPKLHDLVDYLHVMSYDFHGSWNHAGHNSALYQSAGDTVDGTGYSYPAALAFWRDVQGFRTDQIILGLPAYGRGFKVKDWGEKSAGESRYPELTFTDARALIGHGWTRHWDAESHAAWLLSDDKTERISYDDEQSVADKARWMKENQLPGFFLWEIGQEFHNGDYLLTAAAQKAWQEAPEPQ